MIGLDFKLAHVPELELLFAARMIRIKVVP